MTEQTFDPGVDTTQPVEPARPVGSTVSLIISNLIPLLGVVFFHWDLFTIMFLFWFENVVVGFFNALKMLTCMGQGVSGQAAKLFYVPFFCVHYGIFTLVHGVFVVVLFGGILGGQASGDPEAFLTLAITTLLPRLWLPVLAMIVSYTVDFYLNFIANGEYKTKTLNDLMAAPYGRIIVLHLTILFGGMLAMVTGARWFAVALLVILKTGVDLSAHLGRKSLAGQALRFNRTRRRRH
ncbi:MAG: hypothetical protein K1X53_04150 [Candidatus Sumerlaeaceae bacterium]|nr:hypothetical protein [Candidatus Sumerlaeaceae bacterium]